MNLLLTGSGGFIGTALLPLLLRAQHNVFEFQGDVRQEHNYPLGEFAAVVHLAAAIPHRDPVHHTDYLQVNIAGTQRLLRRYPNAHFVLASTLDVKRPTLTEYARSKLAAEEAVVSHALSHCIVRLPSVFGPNQRQASKLIPTLLRHSVLGAPPPEVLHADVREYIWIEDAAELFVEALRRTGLIEASGMRISNHEVASLISAAVVGTTPPDLSAPQTRMLQQLGTCVAALRNTTLS